MAIHGKAEGAADVVNRGGGRRGVERGNEDVLRGTAGRRRQNAGAVDSGDTRQVRVALKEDRTGRIPISIAEVNGEFNVGNVGWGAIVQYERSAKCGASHRHILAQLKANARTYAGNCVGPLPDMARHVTRAWHLGRHETERGGRGNSSACKPKGGQVVAADGEDVRNISRRAALTEVA